MKFLREHLFREKPKTPATIERIDLGGEQFSADLVEREQLRAAGVLLYENVGNFGGSSVHKGHRRKGVQFPHRDGHRPEAVITLQSSVPENFVDPIDNPEDKKHSPEREYVEPYTFVCQSDA